MFQNPYQRCLYERIKLPDGTVWLGSWDGDAEMRLVQHFETGGVRGPALKYIKFRDSLGGAGRTMDGDLLRVRDYWLTHGVQVYRF